MKKIFKEPLLVFLLLGGAIFALFQQVAINTSSDSTEIVVTEGRVQALASGFKKVWQRAPDNKELEALIQNYIRDEVYYREALVMGLDKDDTIIKRRLRQKMEFISEDIASLNTPKEQELQAFLVAHQEDYRQDSRFSFRHIYFDSSKRGQTAQADAVALLAKIQTEDVDITNLGDSLMLKQQFNDETEREIKRALGSQFLQSLRELPKGTWQGPIKSGFGLHLVRIDMHFDGKIPDLNEVREIVIRDWSAQKRKQMNEAFYTDIRKNYTVTVAKLKSNNPAKEITTKPSLVKVSP